MKKLLNRNSIAVGAVAALLSEVLCALLIFLILLIPGVGIGGHERWFAAAFVPPLLLVRYYAHESDYALSLKAAITTLFITFVAFMWAMLKYKYITF